MIHGFCVLAAIYALWICFVVVMAMARVRDAGTMGWPTYVLGTPVFIVGYALDVAINLTVCTVLFLDLPREWTVTARLKRMVLSRSGWRQAIAAWIAVNLLDQFDPSGKHV